LLILKELCDSVVLLVYLELLHELGYDFLSKYHCLKFADLIDYPVFLDLFLLNVYFLLALRVDDAVFSFEILDALIFVF